MKKLFGLIFLTVILLSSSYAQTYGKLYTKSEADNLYGPAVSSVAIGSSDILDYIEKANNYIMFNLTDGKLTVLGEGRRLLCPADSPSDARTVFRVFSTSLVKELLSKGQSQTTTVEKRKEVLSLSNGEYTLEMGGACPPLCD